MHPTFFNQNRFLRYTVHLFQIQQSTHPCTSPYRGVSPNLGVSPFYFYFDKNINEKTNTIDYNEHTPIFIQILMNCNSDKKKKSLFQNISFETR